MRKPTTETGGGAGESVSVITRTLGSVLLTASGWRLKFGLDLVSWWLTRTTEPGSREPRERSARTAGP